MARAIGVPWKRWRADWSGMDCFGVIVLYFREVHGVELGAVPQTDIATGFMQASGWEECSEQAGATCFMSWRDGSPTHCGILMPRRMVLHSDGDVDRPGSVRLTRIAALSRVVGEIKFYRRAPC